jgi:pimeloyl-ACP methyl ester carboxylesterase
MPAPRTPVPLRLLSAIGPLRALLLALYRRTVFSPSILPRAYADTSRAPAELIALLAAPPEAQTRVLFDVIVRGGGGPSPTAPALVVWGADDRLPGTSVERARKVQRGIAGAQLAIIPGAGHCPQVEKPDEFVRIVHDFVATTAHPDPRASS